MTNEEKINELCKYYEMNCDWFQEALGQLAEWKERQLQEACENCLKLHEKYGKGCAFLSFDNKHCWEYLK